MLPERFEKQHQQFLEEWMRVEEALKQTERIKNEAFIPSINELRYAARRVVQANIDLSSGSATDEDVRRHLTEAIENCIKARHDAVDSAINYIHEKLDEACTSIGYPRIISVFPEYEETRKKIHEIDMMVIESRKNRSTLTKQYDEIEKTHLDKMVEFYLKLETSPKIVASMARRDRIRFFGAAVTVGVVLGLCLWGLTLIFQRSGCTVASATLIPTETSARQHGSSCLRIATLDNSLIREPSESP